MKNIIIILITPILFLLTGTWTISDYGINWDEAQHFNRGYSYLHFFLTGEKNYVNLPQYKKLAGADSDYRDIRGNDSILFTNAKKSSIEPNPNFRRSYFQSDTFNYEYFIKNDSGHPPVNGILAALTNYIFYQRLGILGDIESFHLFEIFVSFLLVVGIAIITYKKFGIFPSVVASSSLSLYPLFFGESHFNIKDPVEASFFGLTIISFYFAVIKNNFKLILLSGLFFGLAMGTKFNAFFIPIILTPWLIFYYYNKKLSLKKICLGIFIWFLLAVLILFISWPFLWADPVNNFLQISNYYLEIGTQLQSSQSNFIFLGFNTYPLVWILTTTPIPILMLSLIGLIWLIKQVIKKDDFATLALIWLLIPIIRVCLPGTGIYGGVRQIMEFLPALAILSGVGSYYLVKLFKINATKYLIILGLIFILHEDFAIHPNENIYFNQLIGGLSGAKTAQIPSWGNSFGNAYYQAVVWLNKNALPNANFGLPIGTMVNISRIKLREDINFSNDYFSGFNQLGEYEMELSHDYPPKNWFSYTYLDTYLTPVYEVKVDEVAIAKVWKNDPAHLKRKLNRIKVTPASVEYKTGEMLIDLGKIYEILELKILACKNTDDGYISIGKDGENFTREPETIIYPQMNPKILGYPDNVFFFLFAGKQVRFIKLTTKESSCLLNKPSIEIFVNN